MPPVHPRTPPRDWSEASSAVAKAYFPHKLRLLGGKQEPRLTLRTLDLGPVLIGQVGWGADVSIECHYPEAYEINMPLTGHLASRGRHGSITSVTGQATVFRADTPSLITHWDATCAVLGVKFNSGWLDVEAERLLGGDRVTLRSLLPEQVNLENGPAKAWRNLVRSLASGLHDPTLFAESAVVRDQLAGALAAGFVDALQLANPGPVVPPLVLRRVVQAIHDDPGRAWTAGEMSAIAGTSARRLQEGFQRCFGCTPSKYLRDVRLQRAHADLTRPEGTSISEIAARWGFSSASRFAAAYRQRYGVSPSQASR
jgi:AraC-like DNA-binding protein